MGDWPAQSAIVHPPFIHTWTFYAGLDTIRSHAAASPASITWVTNHAEFVPVSVPFPYPVHRAFWINGSTASSNADFGIYTIDGTKIYSTGSTAQSGASAPQYVAPATPFLLDAGDYYFGFSCSGTTNRAFGTTALTAIFLRQFGILQQSVFPLPTTMGSAVAATQALHEFCGVTRTTTGF